jgi:DHA1 family multidrug resistance protein-like MFS transporter
VAYSIGYVQTAQRLGPAIGPIVGGAVAGVVGLRHAFLVTAAFYVVAVVIVYVMYDERSASHHAATPAAGRVTFKNVLAFENFILLMVVIFGLQFVDRSFGPVLPLYVAQLGTAPGRVPLVSGVLFSISAAAGAIGHHVCGMLLRRGSAPNVIASSIGIAAAGTIVYLVAGASWLLLVATPVFGLAIGVATTAAYTAASSVIPASARGAGFGFLATASLTGLALSPIVSGILGATSIRGVFLLDTLALVVLAGMVARGMIAIPVAAPAAPAPEEL